MFLYCSDNLLLDAAVFKSFEATTETCWLAELFRDETTGTGFGLMITVAFFTNLISGLVTLTTFKVGAIVVVAA